MNEVRQWGATLIGISAHHLKRYMFAANRIQRNMRVLDAACGCGYGAWLLHSLKAFVNAIDISIEAITFAQIHYPGPSYWVADITKLAEYATDYDFAVSFETLEHLAHPEKFLCALKCKTLIASVPNEELYPFKPEAFRNDDYPHQRHYTPEQFEGLLRGCGFRVTESWCQTGKEYCDVRLGTDGKFLIYVCER